ncbi:CoF synthetase [Niallia sp. NCCP-28]|uniref:LuxE/PaaK family acyltransferase n=1 Tax=Niallia sp. NCCP-28 TaxID=2934712 RepID=UPI002081E62C|nr:CoF synthetase [Niallia sp. NCCP-28]GKU83106.1 coenzyme F390 synthetase [Niallia sp. NCCP-28]
MIEHAQEIQIKLLAFMETYGQPIIHNEQYEQEFNELALTIFSYQFQHNQAYKKYCQSKKKTPLMVKHWSDIPLMPIQGFKELTLSTTPIEEAEAVFMTSGTTNPASKGKNYHPALAVWDASMKTPFQTYVLPDREKMTIFVLSPAEDLNKNSSLARYLTNAVSFFGTENSRFFFDETGLKMAELEQALKECEQKGEPVLLIGATFSYVHLMDYLEKHQLSFQLEKGSRIFDTGGFKGRSREVEMEEMYQSFYDFFKIERNHCINMYGMTELSSQIYDQTIWSHYSNMATIQDKKSPAWVKTVILNTDTLQPAAKGEQGVIAHYDLANWNACLAILTEDLGCLTEHGFTLLGRIQGSEARGCSIAVDELLQANTGGAIR